MYNQGKLFVVGIGPGAPELITPEALAILQKCQCIGGYATYMDLLDPKLKAGREIIVTGMRQERERCQKAIEAAKNGKMTALVCSGDPGIYAMASLVLEIVDRDGLAGSLPFAVVPGVPALCAAAARVGAPISHDFACVSLSDLLTPKHVIEMRLKAALQADFVCILYNPRSHGRPDCLAEAISLARQCRSPDCPVAHCRNIGRQGQYAKVCRLENFDPQCADMLSLVIIGNSQSRLAGPYMLTPRGYADKYGRHGGHGSSG